MIKSTLFRFTFLPFLALIAIMGLTYLARPVTAEPNACTPATAGDNAIQSAEIYHDNTNATYRIPTSGIPMTGTAKIILRACKNDIQKVEILVWTSGWGATPRFVYTATVGTTDTTYDYWSYDVPGPGTVVDQWYQFRITDGTQQGHYHPASGNTGPGAWVTSRIDPSWSLPTTQPPAAPYDIPTWLQDAVIYQIFPDRFRNGDPSNDPVDGTAIYEPGGCTGYPHSRPGGATSGCLHDKRNWNDPLLIPSWGLDFHGGDLRGVIQKIDSGYFTDLGVNTLYFNPIFEASSNHGYDTNDYFAIRAYFGSLATFEELVQKAHAKNIRIMLDGVFNHAGMDTKYIDAYNRYGSGITGACESATSPFRPWFTQGSVGASNCSGGWGWVGWSGATTLPEFVDNNAEVRKLFFSGGAPSTPNGKSVSQYWFEKGIDAWRYDVAQDITLDFFSAMRPFVKGTNTTGAVYGKNDYVMLGEVTGGCAWGLYKNYLTANGLDSVMNYCFRDLARDFANGGSLNSIMATYNYYRDSLPANVFASLMNLLSSHDSPRMMGMLNEDKGKFKLAVLFQMTTPGAPSIYYGDEVALSGGNDPDNRRVYPWADTNGGGANVPADSDMYAFFKKVIGIRNTHPALRGGEMSTLLQDDSADLFSFIRSKGDEKMVVVLKNTIGNGNAVIPVGSHLPNGTVLTDLLNGGTFTVTGGNITLSVNGQWGRILHTTVAQPTNDGDVSCDDVTNTVDGLFVMQYDIGLRTANNTCPISNTQIHQPSCDVNNDSQCNTIDALFILQCDVGIPNSSCP